MKLSQSEKIQFAFDLAGSLFCALLLGVACSLFVNPSSSPQPNGMTFWEKFHFLLPFIVYSAFIFGYLKTSFLRKFKFRLFGIFTNLICPVICLFLSFFIRDLVYQRFLTDQSKFVPFQIFLYVVGGIIGIIFFFASAFWLLGLIIGNAVENRGGLVKLNLEN